MTLQAGVDWNLGHGFEGAGGSERFWRGEIEELRVWKTARSVSQIQTGKNRIIESPPDSLLLYYHLDEGQNAHIIRDAGSHKNMVLPNCTS